MHHAWALPEGWLVWLAFRRFTEAAPPTRQARPRPNQNRVGAIEPSYSLHLIVSSKKNQYLDPVAHAPDICSISASLKLFGERNQLSNKKPAEPLIEFEVKLHSL